MTVDTITTRSPFINTYEITYNEFATTKTGCAKRCGAKSTMSRSRLQLGYMPSSIPRLTWMNLNAAQKELKMFVNKQESVTWTRQGYSTSCH
jgi:hypothetical protein